MKNICILIFSTLVISSCSSSKEKLLSLHTPPIGSTTDISIELYTYNSSFINLYSSGITIALTNQDETVTGVTDELGKTVFKNAEPNEYFIRLTSDSLDNLRDIEIRQGKEYGFLIIGVFENESMLDAIDQPGKKIGGIRYYDLNSDGFIDSSDKVMGYPISSNDFYKGINEDGTIDTNDLSSDNTHITMESISLQVFVVAMKQD